MGKPTDGKRDETLDSRSEATRDFKPMPADSHVSLPKSENPLLIVDEIMKVMAPRRRVAGSWQETSVEVGKDNAPLIRLVLPENAEFIVKEKRPDGSRQDKPAGPDRVLTALADKIDKSGFLKTVKTNVNNGQIANDDRRIIHQRGTISIIVKPGIDEAAEDALEFLRTQLEEKNVPRDEWMSKSMQVHVPEGSAFKR